MNGTLDQRLASTIAPSNPKPNQAEDIKNALIAMGVDKMSVTKRFALEALLTSVINAAFDAPDYTHARSFPGVNF